MNDSNLKETPHLNSMNDSFMRVYRLSYIEKNSLTCPYDFQERATHQY